jgi:hypothetical protein
VPERGGLPLHDGGETFEKVLYRDEDTGAVDVVPRSRDARTAYAVLWEARQAPVGERDLQRAGSGVYKTTDGGTTVAAHRPRPAHVRGGRAGPIGITVAPSNPRRLFATVEAKRKAGLYRSDDAGETWTLVNADPRVTDRASDFAEVKVHPQDPDTVFTASIVTWKSTDGGRTFTALRGAPGGDDYHRIWINPRQPDIMLIAADQGVIITVNGGRTWSSWYNQATAQLYHVSTDNAFPYRVCGGQQESGSVCIQSRGDDGRSRSASGVPVGVEEYGYVAVDPPRSRHRLRRQAQPLRPPARSRRRRSRPGRCARPRAIACCARSRCSSRPTDPHTLLLRVQRRLEDGRRRTDVDGDQPGPHAQDLDGPAQRRQVPRHGGGAPDAARGDLHAGPVAPRRPADVGGTDDGLIHVTTERRVELDGRHPGGPARPAVEQGLAPGGVPLRRGDRVRRINTFRLDDLRPAHLSDARPRPHLDRDHGRPSRRRGRERGAGGPQRRGLLFAGTEQAVYASFDDGESWQSCGSTCRPRRSATS